jgi:hypothetical protein
MEEFNMTLNKYLDIAPEVQKALEEGRPVVALESTIISHGMPYPQNVETALNVEKIIRENGAVPATIAVIGGRPVCPNPRSTIWARPARPSPRPAAVTCPFWWPRAGTAPPP